MSQSLSKARCSVTRARTVSAGRMATQSLRADPLGFNQVRRTGPNRRPWQTLAGPLVRIRSGGRVNCRDTSGGKQHLIYAFCADASECHTLAKCYTPNASWYEQYSSAFSSILPVQWEHSQMPIPQTPPPLPSPLRETTVYPRASHLTTTSAAWTGHHAHTNTVMLTRTAFPTVMMMCTNASRYTPASTKALTACM